MYPLKKGDKVYSLSFRVWGEVISITNDEVRPIQVLFKTLYKTFWYTMDGRFHPDCLTHDLSNKEEII